MVLGHRRASGAERKSVEHSRGDATDDETVVDEEQGNVLGHIISQLRPGADLSRVTLPTFILEPRSMLERITNFMAHPEIMLGMPDIDDPVQRFVSVVKFYLSGWHIKPPGVKKPLNPILGETFFGYWDYPDNTKGYYISEQTCHHPPKSSYYFACPEHHIRIDGTLKPRSKFLGNSAASLMEGLAVMRFTNRNERYFVTQPNMYARGILFGKMKYELGDHSLVKCPELGLVADLEFKTKGYFSGSYNAIGGVIKEIKTDKHLFELSGYWHGEMFIKDLKTGKKELLFDASHAKHTPPKSRPIEEQADRESQKLWAKVNSAIKKSDHRAATDEKSLIENQQRAEAKEREESGQEWKPKLFRAVRGGPGESEDGEGDLDWIIDAKIDGKTPEEQVKQILAIAPVLPDSEAKVSQQPTSQAPPAQPQQPAVAPQEQVKHTNGYVDQNQQSQHPAPVPSQQPQATTGSHPAPNPSYPAQSMPIASQQSSHTSQTSTASQDSQLVNSMSRLGVGEPKMQAAEDPARTPRAQPADARPEHVIRMDSQAGSIDEFYDAEQ